jgi:23S rRNA (uracil1939-C5)-methyltransferase
VKVLIDRLGHHGDGIAVGPNGPIFINQMLPGEEVEGDLVGDRLTNTRIITPSDQRVRAPCAHAKICGGCLLQHASDGFVSNWKVDIVKSALAAQGLHADFLPIITSPPRSRRRATLSARRTKSGVLLGFHARASDVLVSIPQCQLLHPDIVAGFPALEALVKIGGSRSGEVSLTVTQSAGGLDVSVMGGKPVEPGLAMELARVVEAFGLARLTWNGEGVALRTMPMQRFGRALVAPPPGTFLQATAEGEAALLSAVANAVGPARRIVDLFAGVGTFALPLAERAEVHAVEGEAAMVAAMEKGWRLAAGLRRLTTESRDLFRRPLEADEFKGFDAVVIDPPRAGAEAQFTTLAKARVPVISSVSCNPVTFARDAKALVQAGYKITSVQVVDQFRWSSHVELVGKFERGS